ncbi:bifunctional pyr operon transcriptional regulator/uracil phosphoribosyltransferase PyrR [Methylocaldum sp.]|uniref:bifunctional pyr operon transcriptional regulator/uracil phosphoribosyltransferase PyrR n=1 Tax=Methylocaldum sp. TaxID=1969727 RepID=UPI002D4C1604|nr:bifunctional pyr operon transcriptional regulator/uracil phosphoribosyltransferase PyrR [Methylocaldum sp.]HYE37704.1 bifunctional pyr operon transcriptional regulator/uracil phosphoribosyltransferase PyrR [Methylocaldum sp.]
MPDTVLQVDQLLDRLEAALREEMARRELSEPAMIGIHTGGAWIAERLHARLGLTEPLGLLNISFYRDDFSQTGIHPQVKPSMLPFRVEGRNILLIDDVFYTGRTIRAALNEIFDYGRPAQVLLGVLIERNGRQIPIRPDCIGSKMTLAADQRITLSGPSPLKLSIHSVSPQS